MTAADVPRATLAADQAGTDILGSMVEDLLSIRPLARALSQSGRLRLFPGAPAGSAGADSPRVQGALHALAEAAGLPPFDFHPVRPDDATSFEIACSRKASLDERRMEFLEAAAGPDLHGLAAGYLRFRGPLPITRHVLDRPSRLPLAYFDCGDRGRPCVLIASACGMPAALCEAWLWSLGRDFHAVTYETRGLFGGENEDPGDCSLEAQAADILAILGDLGRREAHVLGFCGGAVIAVQAACLAGDAIRSLSLWHGDFEFGGECPKTSHQKDVGMLMAMAASSRHQADSLQKMFRRPSFLDTLPADLAHLVMYPYASGGLLHRYGKLNGVIMTTDIRALLPGVRQPVMVVTSHDDSTAHPEGSKRVAASLSGAELRVEERGDHISLFRAGGNLTALARNFLFAHSRAVPEAAA